MTTWQEMYAARYINEFSEWPTDERVLAATAGCVRPARTHEVEEIREAILRVYRSRLAERDDA